MESKKMEQSICNKSNDQKGESAIKFNAAAEYLFTGIAAAILGIEIYFICKALLQFTLMYENCIRLYILNYITN